MRNDFAVFICTHGRSDKQLTLDTLLKAGYTGEWYLVLDDTDKTIQQYIDNYGVEHIIVFDKNHYINNCTDTGDNKGHYKCILYAKNAVEDIAKSLKLKAFMMVDDDIVGLRFRTYKDGKFGTVRLKNVDKVMDAYIEYMLSCNMTTIGFGAPISVVRFGYEDEKTMCYCRTPYQIYLRNASKPVDWVGWYGEDNITMLLDESRGGYWTSVPYMQYDTVEVSTNASGGMAQEYANNTSFELAFNIKRALPSCMTIRPNKRRTKYLTILSRRCAFPLLISDSYRRVQ